MERRWKSAHLTNDMGAPLAGTRPWQRWQALASAMKTEHGSIESSIGAVAMDPPAPPLGAAGEPAMLDVADPAIAAAALPAAGADVPALAGAAAPDPASARLGVSMEPALPAAGSVDMATVASGAAFEPHATTATDIAIACHLLTRWGKLRIPGSSSSMLAAQPEQLLTQTGAYARPRTRLLS